jgi:phage-related minor tail protein
MASKNTIKGLTIEIGGDTTKLGKALEDVDKQTGDLGKELGEINKLLKFDPENTELLAQKQKVLGDMIGNTSKRLDTLKEAEKQVQEQFKRGEVSEAQVRALQREIIETESKLNNYKKQASGASEATKDLGKEAKETTEKGEKMGSVWGAVGTGLTVVTGAATAVVGALVGMAEETREYRTAMGKLDTAFTTSGFTADTAKTAYQELQGVLGDTDKSIEAASHLAKLTDNEKDLAKWTGTILPGVFATFGDSLPVEGLAEAANHTAKVGVVQGNLADALEWGGVNIDKFNEKLALCTNEQERQALITEELTRLYGEAAESYKVTNAEVIKANQANEQWTATMAEAGAAVDPILTDVKMLGASLLQEFIPGITDAATAVRGLLNGEDGAADMLGEALSGLLTQLLEKAVELAPTLVEVAMSLLTTLIDTIVGMLPQLITTGVDIVLAILDGLTSAIPTIVQAVIDIIPMLVDALTSNIDKLINGAIDLFFGILDAIPVLLDALLPQLPDIIEAIVDGLMGNIDTLIDGAIRLFFGILEAIPEISSALMREMPSIVESIVSSLLGCIPDLIDAGGQLLGGLIKGMFDFDWGSSIKKIGDGIVGGFKKVFDIHSPSRVMAELGEMLDQGLAVGIENEADAPVNALDALSEDMVDTTAGLEGLTLERRMEHTFADTSTPSAASGVMGKLDLIYRAILAGQVIMLDGKALIGSTVEGYDSELGQRRVLAERGAL